MLDILRGDEEYKSRERYSTQLLKETIIKCEGDNSDWSLHSDGFKYLASYILRFSLSGDEESKEKMIDWSELVGAISRVIEGTSSIQMAKSCFKLLHVLLKKSKDGWHQS